MGVASHIDVRSRVLVSANLERPTGNSNSAAIALPLRSPLSRVANAKHEHRKSRCRPSLADRP